MLATSLISCALSKLRGSGVFSTSLAPENPVAARTVGPGDEQTAVMNERSAASALMRRPFLTVRTSVVHGVLVRHGGRKDACLSNSLLRTVIMPDAQACDRKPHDNDMARMRWCPNCVTMWWCTGRRFLTLTARTPQTRLHHDGDNIGCSPPLPGFLRCGGPSIATYRLPVPTTGHLNTSGDAT